MNAGGQNSIVASTGNDTVSLNSSTSDTVNAGAGNNSIIASGGDHHSIIAAGGNDSISLTNNTSDTIDAGNGNNKITVDGGDYNKITTGSNADDITVSSGSHHNTINAGNGNNNLTIAGHHNDVVSGTGDDHITVSGSDNTVSSGNGADSITVSGNHNTIDAGDGANVLTVSGGSNSIVSGSGADVITVSGTDNTVHAGDGNDNITISGTDNHIYGEAGDDNIVQTINGNNYIDGGSGADHITVPNGNHWLVDGNDDNDTITVGSDNWSIYGGGGNDSIVGSDGNYIHGGYGGYIASTLPGHPIPADYTDIGYTGPTLHTADGPDTIQVNDRNHVWGNDGADKITARNNNTIYGGTGAHDACDSISNSDGDDTIEAQNGNWISGGDGEDSLIAMNGNHVEGNNGKDKILVNDYNFVMGGAGQDSIVASEYNTVYGGGSGNNADDDRGGEYRSCQADAADIIRADIGNRVYAGAGADTVFINYANLAFGGEGNDTILALDNNSIGGGEGEDCIKAGEHAYIDAGPNDDNIIAGFNSSIWGGDGKDTILATDISYIDGGDGSDSIVGTDNSTIKGGYGADSIKATNDNLIYGDYDENVSIGGAFDVTHAALQNLKRHNEGKADKDTIEALNRNTIYGGYGNDSIVAIDCNIVSGGHDNDSLNLRSYNTISGGADNDTILASDHNLIYGDNLRNGIDPGAGDDSIVARTDNTIYGGAGKDTIIADDQAKIDGGAGADSISYGRNSSIVAGEGDDTVVSHFPGLPIAPNGSAGSTIWGGTGAVDSAGRPVYALDSHGNPIDPKVPGATDIHGHNVFTGDDVPVTIMDFKFGNDVIHFGKAFEASAVTAFGYGNSTIVPAMEYQLYTAGTDRINVAATISDAAKIDMQNELGKFVIFGYPNGTLKGGFANTLIGGRNNDTIYAGEGDYVYGGLGDDTINLHGYNGWRDHVGLTEEGGTDSVTSFQQGWDEGDDAIWYNVPIKKELTNAKGEVTDVRITNTDAEADLNDTNVRIRGNKTILTQGRGKLILNGVTHGEILVEDGKGVHKAALLGDGYFNDSTRGGEIFIGRKEYSDKVSFEKNNRDLVADLGMTNRFKERSAKYYSIEQVIGGAGNNTLVGAKNIRNTLEGGIGTSSLWGGGASADLLVSGTGSATDHYTTFFYGAGDGSDTIEGFRTTDRTEAHFKRDILDIHSGDVASVRKDGTSVVVNMTGLSDKLTIRNAASGLFDQLIEVDVMGRKGAAKVTGAYEIVTYDPHAQYYFSNSKAGGTVNNFGDNSRIYLDGRTGDYYQGFSNIDVECGNRLELAGNAANNRIIYRGTGTASLYGSLGDDTLTGSKDGMNRFFFGRSDGNDIITKSTASDKVMLYDVALEDVTSAVERNGSMQIALKSGAHLTIQNFDENAVHDFKLATGDTWVYNHTAGGGGFWSPKGNYPAQR